MENTEITTENIYQTRTGKTQTFVVLSGIWVKNSYKSISNPMKKIVPATMIFIIDGVERMVPNKVSICNQIANKEYSVKVPLWLYNKWNN